MGFAYDGLLFDFGNDFGGEFVDHDVAPATTETETRELVRGTLNGAIV